MVKHLAPALLALLAPVALASDLDVAVQSGGSSTVTVNPGDTVNYSLVGELTDNQNEGLAFFVVDISFDGGALSQADDPGSGSTMDSFSTPEGMNNPAGFGGTPSSGDLLQVGGAQNTIGSLFAAAPTGSVTTGVAANGSPQTLVTGSLTAPQTPGTYTLSLSDLRASVVRQGDTGSNTNISGFPYWKLDKAGAGTVTDLTVEVASLSADVTGISMSAGGTQTLTLDAGAPNAGRFYLVLGSLIGSSPGFPIAPGVTLPLNIGGPYFTITLTNPSLTLTNSFNLLNGQGESTATFSLPPGTDVTAPNLVGKTVYHAYALLTPAVDFASNAVPCQLNP